MDPTRNGAGNNFHPLLLANMTRGVVPEDEVLEDAKVFLSGSIFLDQTACLYLTLLKACMQELVKHCMADIAVWLIVPKCTRSASKNVKAIVDSRSKCVAYTAMCTCASLHAVPISTRGAE